MSKKESNIHNNDLEKFRKLWKKELSEAKTKHGEDQPSTSDKDLNPSVHKVNHFSDYHVPPVNAELARVPLQDDNSCDGFDVNRFKPQLAGQNEPSEYYPFKILSQFLNEAPKRIESRKTKAALSSPTETASKRKYFQETESKNKIAKIESQQHCEVKDEQKEKEEKHDMLDLFLADLDEINEIPFFDTSVPREVALRIFQHLDMRTLCACSQVSRSWQSLADDELLWFQVYLRHGLARVEAEELHVSQASDWKGRVRKLVEEKNLLDANWKARTGKPYQLNFAQGGVLCAVHSHGANIVAGYTSCNIRQWDTRSGDTCTYNASNTALVLDDSADDEELCRVENSVQHIQTTGCVTAASFTHGFVDVWSSEGGTDPIHTLSFNNRNISSLTVCNLPSVSGNQSSLVAAAQATRVQAALVSDHSGQSVLDFDAPAKVSHIDWLSEQPSQHYANLLVTTQYTACIKRVDLPTECIQRVRTPNDWTEVHNIFWAPITAVSLRPGSQHLAVGFNVYAGAAADIKVNMYDLSTQRLTSTLKGHTWVISSIHLPEALPSQLATGSGDRKIRIYDLRAATFPLLTLAGHSAKVNSVEMDEWKLVSGDEAGFVCVWDQRMARKLWDVHNRHPVEYCHCEERLLVIGNVPYQKFPETDEFDKVSALRYRGTLQVYDFLANQQREDIPSICLSAYDEPEAYDYNIGLAVPYDKVG